MKALRCFKSLGCLLAFLTLAGCDKDVSRNSAAEVAKIFGKQTLEQALEKAKTDGKVVMIDFYADWCGPCKKLDADTWTDAKVQEWLLAKTVPLKIDVDAMPALAQKHSVSSIPALVFLKPDGTEIGRLTGLQSPAAFLGKAGDLLRGM